MYEQFKANGIDEIYCISVNDAFVMNEWGRALGIKNIKLIPDGTGHFTRLMGMLVNKDAIGFGYRSHRYAAIINDGVVMKMFEEAGREDNHNGDPYIESSPENILAFLTTELS
jgi:peroxiredoxin